MRKVTIPGVGEVDFDITLEHVIAAEREVGPLYKAGPAGTMPKPRVDEMYVVRALAWRGCGGKVTAADLGKLSMPEFIDAFMAAVISEVIGEDVMDKARAMMLANAAKSEAPKDAGGE